MYSLPNIPDHALILAGWEPSLKEEVGIGDSTGPLSLSSEVKSNVGSLWLE